MIKKNYILDILLSKGLSYTDAYYILCNTTGIDLIYLENCLLSDSTENIEYLKGILSDNNIIYEPFYKNISIVEKNNILYSRGYTIKINNICDKIIYFLKDSGLSYLSYKNNYYIKCPDETTAFVIDNYINSINKGKLEENDMAKNKRSIADLKKKIESVRPKDPNHQLANKLNMKNGGFMDQGKTKRKDNEGRGAKHKKSFRDCDLSSSSNTLNEGKLGFSNMESIGMQNNFIDFKRLAELSGLRENDLSLIPQENDDVDSYIDDTSVGDITGDFSTDIDEVPIDTTVVPVETNSEAMSSIMDFLNNIQSLLPDIRLCEYKPLMIKIGDLYSQTQSMGAGYLSERKKK